MDKKSWKCLNRDVIKYIAMFTMFLNHFAHVFLTEGSMWYEILVDIGYFTAVPMCFFLVEGFRYTKSVKAYGRRLLFFAVISQIPFVMAFAKDGQWFEMPLNMMATLFLCFLMLCMLEQGDVLLQRKHFAVWGFILASCICDWAVIAPFCTYLFWEAKGDLRQQKKGFFWAAVLHGAMNFASRAGICSVEKNLLLTFGNVVPILCAAAVVLYFYNGKRMKKGKNFSKYFFYWFYPVHLLILGILRMWK